MYTEQSLKYYQNLLDKALERYRDLDYKIQRHKRLIEEFINLANNLDICYGHVEMGCEEYDYLNKGQKQDIIEDLKHGLRSSIGKLTVAKKDANSYHLQVEHIKQQLELQKEKENA